VLNTVLKGGTSLKTPMPGFAGTTRGAVATVIRRDGPGMNARKVCWLVHLCLQWRSGLNDRGLAGSKCGLADAIVVTTKGGRALAYLCAFQIAKFTLDHCYSFLGCSLQL
jgi:hypothetical protein